MHLQGLAAKTEGFDAADLHALVDRAVLEAVRQQCLNAKGLLKLLDILHLQH